MAGNLPSNRARCRIWAVPALLLALSPPGIEAVQDKAGFTAPAGDPDSALIRKNSASPKSIPESEARFSGMPLTMDLLDMPLVDFFRLMAEEGGINIVIDPEIKGEISIKVVKVPWDQIFEAVLANHNLDMQVEGTLVRIARKSTLQEEARQRESLKTATLLAEDLETRIKRLNYAKAENMISALEDQKTGF